MHLNYAFLGAGIWAVGTGIDSLPALTAGSILKIVGGVILIVAAVIA